MGWLSSAVSFVSSAVSSVASGIESVAKAAVKTASTALSWMADKAEKVWDGIKEVWKAVKPYIATVRKVLQVAAATVGKSFPWLAGALLAIDRALAAIEAFSDSKLAKKIDEAVKKAIEYAKVLKEKFLTDEEMEEAQAREKVYEEASQYMDEEGLKGVTIAKLVDAYLVLKTRIHNLLSEKRSLQNFEHYLRLRATQKILVSTEDKLDSAVSIEDISEEDYFLIDVGNDLLKDNPALSEENAVRLDDIVNRRYGKDLLPFVFEEMIIAWGINQKQLEGQWKASNLIYSAEAVKMKRLVNEQALVDLSGEDSQRLAELQAMLPMKKDRLDLEAKRKREMAIYVNAAEGLLQILEKTPEQLIEEDREYLYEDSETIGKLIIDCAQHGRKWETLTSEEQQCLEEYSAIFEEESKVRAKELVEVEV